jgi:hypothetical protein
MEKILTKELLEQIRLMSYDRSMTLSEQKSYKNGNDYFVDMQNQTYQYIPKSKTWFRKNGANLEPIEKYDSSGNVNKASVDLITKLNNTLKQTSSTTKTANTKPTTKWKDTQEGKRTLKELNGLGIKLQYEPMSMNHAYAMASVESTRKINTAISNKIGGTNWNKYSICINKVNGKCKYDGFANFNTFDLPMANAVNSFKENVEGLKSPYFMILQNFYFDYGKIYEDLKTAFKYNKDASNSPLFPDGWWNWYNKYYGTNNLNQILSKVGKIASYNLPDVSSKIKVADSESLYDLLSDGHTLLDIASIIATLLPPPAGIVTAGAIDATNALWYVGEGHPWLAFFTAIGVAPAIKQAKYLTKSPKVNESMVKFIDEVTLLNKTKKLTQSKIDNVFAKHTKNLTNAEKLTFGQELKNVAKHVNKNTIDNLYKTINSWNQYSKYDQNLLKNLLKDEKNAKMLETFNGDLDKVLNELRKKLSKEQIISFVSQVGLYAIFSEVLPLLIPEDLIKDIYKSGLIGFKEKIEGYGYDWNETLKIFAVEDSKTNPEQYRKDLVLLEQAWNSGWRPFNLKTYEEIEVPEEYQTNNYKNKKNTFKTENIEYRVKGDNSDVPPNTKIIYVDNQEESDLMNDISTDSTITNYDDYFKSN